MKSSCDASGEAPQSTAGGITVHAFKGVIIKGKEERGEKNRLTGGGRARREGTLQADLVWGKYRV